MDSAALKQSVIRQIQSESNVANSRELFEKVNENCFEKCVPKPGASLSSGESSCVTMCMDKYIAAWNKVNATLLTRMQQENKALGH